MLSPTGACLRASRVVYDKIRERATPGLLLLLLLLLTPTNTYRCLAPLPEAEVVLSNHIVRTEEAVSKLIQYSAANSIRSYRGTSN